MLDGWVSRATKGNPTFIEEGDLRTIECGEGERGIWSAVAPVTGVAEVKFVGTFENGRLRMIFINDEGFEVDSALFLSITEGDVFPVPTGAITLRVNCIRVEEGIATFDGVDFVNTEEVGLPIPNPDETERIHITGWMSGSILSLWRHGDVNVSGPPTYKTASDELIPYEVTGHQTGRNINLTIGNMYFPPEEDEGDEEL